MTIQQQPMCPGRVRTRRRVDWLFSTVVLGTSGAIASQTPYAASGMTITKTAAKNGRYTVQVWKGYKAVKSVCATLIGADDAALATGTGLLQCVRDLDVGAGALDGTFELQWARNDTAADAEVTNNLSFLLAIALEL